MSQGETLLCEVCEYPEEDAPRLVYADWLDEHGQAERAAYIRLKVEQERVPPYEPRWFELDAAAWKINLDLAWDKNLRRWPGLRWPPLEHRRGLPARIEANSVADLLAGAGELFASYPIEEVTFRAVEDPAALAASPWLTRLRSLQLHLRQLEADVCRVLGDSPHLTNLTRLQFPFGRLDDDAATALAASPLLDRLKVLELYHYGFPPFPGDPVARALAGVARPLRLEELNLSRSELGDGSVEELARSGVLATVTKLNLENNRRLGSPGVQGLLRSPHLTRLTELKLSYTDLRTRDMVELAARPNLGTLRALHLGYNGLGPMAARVLAGSPHLAGLKLLDLEHNPLTDKGAAALAESPHLTNLVVLDLSEAKIGDAGGRSLLAAPGLQNLRRLNLRGNPLGDEVKEALRQRFGKVGEM